MPDIVKSHLLVEPDLPASEPIVMLLAVDHIMFLFSGVDNLPQSKLLSRCFTLGLLEEDFRSDNFRTSSVFLHLCVIFDPPESEV